MEEIVESGLSLIYVFLTVVSVCLLLVRGVKGRPVRWLVVLVVSEGTLSCLVHSLFLKVALATVLCGLVHYIGSEEIMLPTLNKAVLITGKTCLLLPHGT